MEDTHILQQVLYEEIPLTQAMGIRVDDYDQFSLSLSAPLSNNINHKCTAFGGSLYSLAVLTGWGLIYLKMKQVNMTGHIVIQHSEVDYRYPVEGELKSLCNFESEQQIEKFIKSYRKYKKERLQLETRIIWNQQDAVIFKGRYVVHS